MHRLPAVACHSYDWLACGTVVKIDSSKQLAFLLQDLKLISNQQQLISKTDTNAINDPISGTRRHNTRPINANWLS